MFELQPAFLLLVLFSALVIFGPEYLPALARALARLIHEFMEATRRLRV